MWTNCCTPKLHVVIKLFVIIFVTYSGKTKHPLACCSQSHAASSLRKQTPNLVVMETASPSLFGPTAVIRCTGLPTACLLSALTQCFSTAGPRTGTGPWHQLYRAARSSPGICHFSFLSIFHEWIFYSGDILKRIIFLNVSKSSDPERLNNICVANVSDQDFTCPVIDNNLNVILYLSTCHTVYISALILFMIMP